MSMASAVLTSVIGGYLGAGKTSLVNHILAFADMGLRRRLAVLVNDFGALAVDDSLIVARDVGVLALSNGCICCAGGGDLFRAIDRILRLEPRPERLLIEASGVADPARIAQIAVAEPELRLGVKVTVVDGQNFLQCHADSLLADTMALQVAAADVLVVTKEDRGPATAVRRRVAALNPRAALVGAQRGRLTWEMLEDMALQAAGSAAGSAADKAPGSAAGRASRVEHARFASWSYQGAARLAPAALRTISAPRASGVYRLKGWVMDDAGQIWQVARVGAHWQQQRLVSTRARADHPHIEGTKIVVVGTADRFDSSAFATAFADTCAMDSASRR